MPDNSFLEGITHEGLKAVLETVQFRDGHQKEFLNAVHEVAISLQPLLEEDESWLVQFERLCEPERTIIFRVPWLDDNNDLRINRGVRVQFSSAIGPYKGGLRFHPTFRLSIAKMLAFEQCFKNALTGLPLGAGKGGSDFDPKGKSDGEIQRFCQSFMTELIRYIDDDVDVPAGDIGVGTKEIGYLFGQYKRISGRFQPGVLTGKGIGWGGSWCRPEATGYGVVYITQEVLADREDSLKGKRCLVSGSGNVALHCAKKLVEEGAVVLSVSDSGGSLLAPEGLSAEVVDEIQKLKSNHNGRLADFKASDGIEYFGDKKKPWQLDVDKVDIAFPCATQNELDEEDAKSLAAKGCFMVTEGANMPCTAEATAHFHSADILYVPGKMANAGGVAVSGLEMTQNRTMLTWTADDVTKRLRTIMREIYQQAKANAEKYKCDLVAGANIAAFLNVASAMKAQGAV